jgi:hypothetical protein
MERIFVSDTWVVSKTLLFMTFLGDEVRFGSGGDLPGPFDQEPLLELVTFYLAVFWTL